MTNSDRAAKRSNSLLQHPRESVFRRPTHLFKPAEQWPCHLCGLCLGGAHILNGVLLVIYDVATNTMTETAFATTAAICCMISGVLGLISAKRLDKGSVTLFLIFSLSTMGLCLTMFVENAVLINRRCSRFGYHCTDSVSVAYSVLLIFATLEGFIALVSVIVAIQSLRSFYRSQSRRPLSPYEALIAAPNDDDAVAGHLHGVTYVSKDADPTLTDAALQPAQASSKASRSSRTSLIVSQEKKYLENDDSKIMVEYLIKDI